MKAKPKIRLVTLLIIAVLLMSIAFAAMSQVLTINGTGKMKPAKWDIHFDEPFYETKTGDAIIEQSAKIYDSDNTKIGDYSVKLTKPGDSVTYVFDVVNEGDINAELTLITGGNKGAVNCTGTGADAENDKIIVEEGMDYTLKYKDGGDLVQKGDKLDAGDRKTMVLKLELNGNVLPKSAVTLSNLGVELVYTQNMDTNQQQEVEIELGDNEYKINNEILEFDKIVTVGSNEEIKTITEALDYLKDNGYTENSAIVLKEGSYNTASLHIGTSYGINLKYDGMSVSIIGDEPGKVFVTSGEMGISQDGVQYACELKFYRIVFTTPVYSDVGNNGFHLNLDSETKEYYNCVFLPPVGGYNGFVSNTNINVYNCLFLGSANSYYYSNPISGLAQNCASKDSIIAPSNGTKESCLTNVTVDEKYYITSDGWEHTGIGINPDGTQANIGVYGGKYAWDNLKVNVNEKLVSVDVSKVYSLNNIKSVKYLYGKCEESDVISKGKNINIQNKQGNFNAEENGCYTIVVIGSNGKIFSEVIKVEGLDVVSKYKINNENLEFQRIITVGENGELSTVKEAFDYLKDNDYGTTGAIVLKEGKYDTQGMHAGYSGNIPAEYKDMKVSIISDSPGKSVLTSGEMGMGEINPNYSIALKFYRIVFDRPIYSDVSDNGFHLNADKETKEYYNCVFLAPIGGYSGIVSDANVNVYNCLFLGGANSYYYSNPISGLAQNCASKDSIIEPYNGTKETCLTNVTVDEKYNITSSGWEHTGTGTNPDGTQANIGVYGGKYSW